MIRRGGKDFDLVEIGGLLFFVLCFMVVINFLQNYAIKQKLDLEIATDEMCTFQVFWRKSGEGYTQEKSSSIKILPTQDDYQIPLPVMVGVDFLRIDPLDKPASLHIKAARMLLPRKKPVDFLPSFARNAENVKQMTLVQDAANGSLLITSSGDDPNFEIGINPQQFWYFDWKLNFTVLAVPVLLFGVLFRQDTLKGSQKKGVLALSLPPGVFPKLNMLPETAGIWQEKRKDRILYWLDVKGVEDSLPALVEILKQDNPEATIRFQYNRSGEV